jgi:uncharacterized membrane protein
MKTLKKEIPYLLIATLPFIYLASIFSELDTKVPTHWNSAGEIDSYSDKSFLFVILFLITGLNYLIFLVLPKLDPKQKIQQMGAKLDKLRLILTVFMSALGIYIVFLAQNNSNNPELIIPLVGLLFVFIGNYLQTLKPNYFIGIRTPWTLENDEVWKTTHKLGGKLWFAGGLVMALTFLLPNTIKMVVFLTIAAIITLIPIIYSYTEFKRIKNSNKI